MLSENGLSEMAVSDLIRSGFFGVYQKWPFLTTIFYLIRSGLRPDLMVGKCCQKILILGGRFSENILPSGDFLSRLMGENVPFVKYLQDFNFSGGMLRTGTDRTRSSITGPGTRDTHPDGTSS